MIRIFLIAIAAGVIYYGIGIAALTALYRCGLIRRMAISPEEQTMIIALWPLYVTIVLPVSCVSESMAKKRRPGRHLKK